MHAPAYTDPILYAEREARAEKREPISPNHSPILLKIAGGDETWRVAFPGLADFAQEHDENGKEYRS